MNKNLFNSLTINFRIPMLQEQAIMLQWFINLSCEINLFSRKKNHDSVEPFTGNDLRFFNIRLIPFF